MFNVYILYSENKNRYYVGQTNDLNNRFYRHNSSLVQSTKYGVPWKIIHYIEFNTRSEAMQMELKIKKRGIKRYLDDHNINS